MKNSRRQFIKKSAMWQSMGALTFSASAYARIARFRMTRPFNIGVAGGFSIAFSSPFLSLAFGYHYKELKLRTSLSQTSG